MESAVPVTRNIEDGNSVNKNVLVGDGSLLEEPPVTIVSLSQDTPENKCPEIQLDNNKADANAGLSKRAKKRLEKKLAWQLRKPEKRQIFSFLLFD